MSSTWYAAFGLLTVLCLTNSLVLVGLLRQVGVLHERIAPNPPGAQVADEKLVAGTVLPKLDFEPVSNPPLSDPFAGPLTLMGFVRPGCGVCRDLPPLFRTYRKGVAAPNVTSVLVTDATRDASVGFLEEMGLKGDDELPLLRSPDLVSTYGIPGSPYVIAFEPADGGELTVMSSGVVNTLEQLEILVEQAIVFRDVYQHADGDAPATDRKAGEARPTASGAIEAPTTAHQADPQLTTNRS